MTFTHNQRISLAITALLFSTLACRAVTRLIIPDTPTPQPTATIPPTAVSTSTPISTPTTVVFEASCPQTLETIIHDATFEGESSLSGKSDSNQDVTDLIDYSV